MEIEKTFDHISVIWGAPGSLPLHDVCLSSTKLHYYCLKFTATVSREFRACVAGIREGMWLGPDKSITGEFDDYSARKI